MAGQKLSASQRSKIRRLATPKELAPDEEAGELNIVPFLDIIMNVLMFVLATISVTFTATIQTVPPKTGGRPAAKDTAPTLGLTVLIVPDGFSMKAKGGNVAPGCSDTGPGLAIPKKADAYDYAALKACATKLKGMQPDFADEKSVTIAPNPNVPMYVIVNVMDALRLPLNPKPKAKESDPDDVLFPEVNFGVAR
jgi:biopolymer transport protein TolR